MSNSTAPAALPHPATDACWNIYASMADVPPRHLATARPCVRWELERLTGWSCAIGKAARAILLANPYPAFAL
jgi:hypothetical protein